MSKNLLNTVRYPQVGSNTFDLSHDVKMSFKMGRLYPTLCMDVIPGDRIRLSTETMLRFAPLIAPVMHHVNVTTHFFFVPNRILWPNWEKWITGDLDTEPPYITTRITDAPAYATFDVGSLADYLGLPTGGTGTDGRLGDEPINALPFAAYCKIWDEYYRDQNLQNERFVPLTDGDNTGPYALGPTLPEAIARGECFPRAWMHDYFTSALPFAQKGDAVQIPLYGFENVPVQMQFGGSTQPIWRSNTGPTYPFASGTVTGSAGAGSVQVGGTPGRYDPADSLIARTDLLEGQSADINDLRRAFRLQEWLEKNARGGTRYIESMLVHFGVRSSDARLNRPEYLGGAKQKMVISEVLSTAETEVPVGQMAGHGISVGSGNEFTYRAEEHGWIIGLINVQPVTAYQQGLHKKWSRPDRLDYFWPSFAHLGEQEIRMKEIMAFSTTAAVRDEVWGYIPRYAEYRFENSRVAGEFRTSLAYWHMGRIFDSSNPPYLNEEFIQATDVTDRIFAVTDPSVDVIYGHIWNDIRALRKMPKYGTPSF